jgi:hypothetical protein
MAISGGIGAAAGTWVYAYKDSKVHIPFLPWNPPVLYKGLLLGGADGLPLPKVEVGAMGQISRAFLWDGLSIPY